MSEKKLQNYPIAKKENESRRIKPNTKVKKKLSLLFSQKNIKLLKNFKNRENIFGKTFAEKKNYSSQK